MLLPPDAHGVGGGLTTINYCQTIIYQIKGYAVGWVQIQLVTVCLSCCATDRKIMTSTVRYYVVV